MIVEVTKATMPGYMFRHFNKAIKKKRKSAGYLVERGYEFYVCEDIHSEIRGGTRYDGSDIITFKGIRIRMSTNRPHREYHLGCYSHDNESSVKFTVPPPKPDPTITPSYPCDFGAFDFVGQMISFLWWAWQRVVSSKKYGLRYSFIIGFVDRMFASTISYDSYGQSSFHELWLGVWLVYGIVVAAWTASSWSKHWNEYLGEQYKPKRKANGEQMLMLGDLFEGYDEQRKPSKTPYIR